MMRAVTMASPLGSSRSAAGAATRPQRMTELRDGGFLADGCAGMGCSSWKRASAAFRVPWKLRCVPVDTSPDWGRCAWSPEPARSVLLTFYGVDDNEPFQLGHAFRRVGVAIPIDASGSLEPLARCLGLSVGEQCVGVGIAQARYPRFT